jgi:hypothetical protein
MGTPLPFLSIESLWSTEIPLKKERTYMGPRAKYAQRAQQLRPGREGPQVVEIPYNYNRAQQLRPGREGPGRQRKNVSKVNWKNKGKQFLKYLDNVGKTLEKCNAKHHAIYIGNGTVVGFPEGIQSLRDVVNMGNKVYALPPDVNNLPTREIVKRATQYAVDNFYSPKLSIQKYNMFERNCEHFASFILTGKATSFQADRAKLIAAIGALKAGREAVVLVDRRIKQVKEIYLKGKKLVTRFVVTPTQEKTDRQKKKLLASYGLKLGMSRSSLNAWVSRQPELLYYNKRKKEAYEIAKQHVRK